MMYNTSEFNMGSGFMENMINREMEVQILREAVTVKWSKAPEVRKPA